MPEKSTVKKSSATLAADLRKVRERKPTAKQTEELSSPLEEPQETIREIGKRKSVRSLEREQSNLETANEMWKAAFQIKRARFKSQNPSLSESELEAVTVDYFRMLARSKSAW